MRSGYAENEILTIDDADARGLTFLNGSQGKDCRIQVNSVLNSNPGVNDDNLHRVTTPIFDQVDVVTANQLLMVATIGVNARGVSQEPQVIIQVILLIST